MARRNISKNNFGGRIQVLTGELPLLMAAGLLTPKFDFILLDCGNKHYEEYLQLCLDLLAPQELIVVDNIFFLSDAMNEEPTIKKGKEVLASLKLICKQTDLDISIVPIGDGMLLIRCFDIY